MIVIGAGGHAKVVIATLQAAGYEVQAAFDDRPPLWGTRLLGVTVQGPIKELERLPHQPAILAIGDNATRRRLASRLKLQWATVVHPRAIVHESARLGPGTIVMAGAVVQPDVVVGGHVILNTACSVDHDCSIGDFAHLAPGVRLAGSVKIGAGAFMGIGSVAIPGTCVGEGTVVGAGSVVLRDVPPDVVAVGVPARIVKQGWAKAG